MLDNPVFLWKKDGIKEKDISVVLIFIEQLKNMDGTTLFMKF